MEKLNLVKFLSLHAAFHTLLLFYLRPFMRAKPVSMS